MRVLLEVLLAGTLGITPVATPHADAREHRHGPRSITFQGDCIDTPGHMTVRQVRRDGDRVVLRMRATGMQHRSWYGQATVLYGSLSSSGGQMEQFDVRTPRGRAGHASVFGVPDGFASAGVMLMDIDTDGQPACQVNGGYTRKAAGVGMYHAQLSAGVRQERVQVSYSSYTCRGDTTWRAVVVATWRDRTVTSSLGSDECLNGVVSLTGSLPGRRVPRALSIVARDDDGHDWRASYAVG